MAKKAAKTATKTVKPNFQPGQMVMSASLVVDANGVAWWVDPDKCYIARVDA